MTQNRGPAARHCAFSKDQSSTPRWPFIGPAGLGWRLLLGDREAGSVGDCRGAGDNVAWGVLQIHLGERRAAGPGLVDLGYGEGDPAEGGQRFWAAGG